MFSFLPGISQLLVMISGAKWFWSILNNWGTIRIILKNSETVVQGMLARRGTLPTCEETKLLLDSARLLFEKGLIDLPMVDEQNLARVLGNIENNLVCEIEKKEVKNDGK